jgi:hypothetical protein
MEVIDNSSPVKMWRGNFQNGTNSINIGKGTGTSIIESRFLDEARDAIMWTGGFIFISDCIFESIGGLCLNGTEGQLNVAFCTFKSNGPIIRALDIEKGGISLCNISGPEEMQPGDSALVELGGNAGMGFSEIHGGGKTQLRIRSGHTNATSVIFSKNQTEIMEGAELEVRWTVYLTVCKPGGRWAQYALLRYTDCFNQTRDRYTEVDGTLDLAVSEYLMNHNKTVFLTPYWFNASNDSLTCNLSVNVNQDMKLKMELRDMLAPLIAFTSPANGSLQNRSQLTVAGTASDETGNVSVRIRVDSGDWLSAGGAGNWSLPLNLNDGTHIIEAEAQDNASNTATASVTITIDTIPPAIKIMEPAQDMLVNTTSIEITGLTEPGAALWVDGEVVPVSLGAFRMNKQLREGPNRILLLARDGAGNTATAELRITRDTFPPALIVSSPFDGFVTNRTVITVSGTSENGAEIYCEGTLMTGARPFFSFNTSFHDGSYNISVTAQDVAGNRNKVSIRLTVDTLPPFIDLELVNGTVTRADTIILAGRTEPGAGLSINGLSVAVGINGNFRTNISLHLGTNKISVLAQDAAGNIATLQRTVVKDAGDGTGPDDSKTGGGTSWKPEWTIAALIVAIAVIILYMAIRPNKGLGAPRDDLHYRGR